ncbi:fidgetin-like protein 1 [Xenia sp. Carnegie-2017]|uniref:fidgetin-like protein 1 n=1 Tax=Xenia sp. Carnegie-2017 TaxID=2897299 RepID=UPI001F04C1DD|nr:fidgetin-like protein 1 [Xenia sp. Carnegie-2017]
MNIRKEDVELLNIWQTFQFGFEDTENSHWNRADASRSLIFQVEKLFQSGVIGPTEYLHFLNKYQDVYFDVVDEQDESKGLNNYAEQTLALTSATFRNDSERWKSSLTFDSLDDFNISNISSQDYKKFEKSPFNIKANHPSVARSYVQETNQSVQTTTTNLNPNEISLENANNKDFDLFNKYNSQKCHTRTANAFTSNKAVDTSFDQNASRNKDRNEFVTARQQHVMNERNKKGKQSGSCLNSANYVTNMKKSLGYRRGPSSRFIPPVKNNDDENDYKSYKAVLTTEKGKKPFQKEQGCSLSEVDDPIDDRLKGIDPKMIELINNEIMDHGPPVDWDDIAGLEFAKTVIKEIVVWPMLRPDIFKGLRGPPKGLLLFGPPGTGKTLIGKCIASQSKATFFSISASSLTSKWVGEGEKMVRALFAVARCHQTAVIFIDEIDSLLSQRSDNEHESSRRIKTEFLVQLDGATTYSEDRLLVVGATNRPQEIDEAARRRLVKRLYIPLPEGEARKQIICNLLEDQHYSLSDEDFQQIVTRSEGYSGSDMSNLCREAALGPIRSISGNIQAITSDQVRPIVFADFEKAFRQVRASVSTKDLDLYHSWNKQFGSGH